MYNLKHRFIIYVYINYKVALEFVHRDKFLRQGRGLHRVLCLVKGREDRRSYEEIQYTGQHTSFLYNGGRHSFRPTFFFLIKYRNQKALDQHFSFLYSGGDTEL